MNLVNTRNDKEYLDFKSAILNPSSNGLYAPLTLPSFDGYGFKDLSYKDFALELIKSFDFGYDEFFTKALLSYDNFDDKLCPIKIKKINENLYINELYHGPTRAFKDMALQPFSDLLIQFTKNKKILIICATSGDTGPATLEGFANSDIRVVCIYPANGTSFFQALQMNTSKAKNLKTIAIDGDFDAAQSVLKEILNDDDFKISLKKLDIELSVANSINFGRILFQIIYHYYALVKINKIVDIIIPSGNFGNALGAYYAKKMGAKINKIKIASNSNNILSDFFNTGVYDLRDRVLKKTISPAMDILISSNIERLIFDKFGVNRCKELFDELKNNKIFNLNNDELKALKIDFDANWCNDIECKDYIKQFSKTTLIDPHTATCFKLLDDTKTTLISSTAEWIKFVPSMYEALFNEKCKDEKKAMTKIANIYNYNINKNILSIFDKDYNTNTSYKINKEKLKNMILEWIKGK